MKSEFEQNGGTYQKVGDYYLPNLKFPDESAAFPIGKFGRMRKRYLGNYKKMLFSKLLTTCTLDEHLSEIEKSCYERMEQLVLQMAKAEDVTENLKSVNRMEWVRQMNNIRNRAEEIIINEIIYQ